MQLKALKLPQRLTPRQMQLLKAIAGFQNSQCYSPTIAELACELGISRSTVFEHIEELRRKELLQTSPGRARSSKLTSKAIELLSCLSEPCSSSDYQSQGGVPLAGMVAAGLPIEAVENIETLSLGSQFGTGDDIFALEVSGESMIGADIRDGDFVICKKTPTARDGQLVVAIVDNENATLKRFYKEPDQARLEPANDDYEPIYSDNCRIEGVVVGLVRKF